MLWAVVFLMEVMTSSSLLADAQTDQVQVLNTKANQILAKLHQTCSDLYLKQLGPAHFDSTWKIQRTQEDNEQIMIFGATVELGSKDYTFTLKQSDDSLLDFGNSITDAPQPDKPHWTETKAIATAAVFLKILAEPLPLNVKLGKPDAQYIDTTNGPSNVHCGYWSVCWPRIDSKNHVFNFDHVTIDIHEGYGASGATIDITTPFNEEKGEPMKESDALSKARVGKLVGRSFDPYSSTDKLIENKFMKSELAVVIPQKNADTSQGPKRGLANRLAWILWFQPIHSEKRRGPGYDDSFAVWVDAYNGEIIGTMGWL